MASNFPPQLQLSLQPNTTNFKRSFEQFGVDVESPVGSADAGGSGSNGNDRNKRARSSSSFSEGSESTGSSTMASGSGSSSSSLSFSREETGTSSGHPIVVLDATMPLAPPRLPTPLIEDIDMADYVENPQESMPSVNTVQEQRPLQTADSYRLSLERFHAFESEMSLLRQSPPSAVSAVRLPTPPPTLPPISISTSPSHTAIPIFQTQTEPFSDNIFARLESPSTHLLGSVEDVNNNIREEQSTEEAPVLGFQNMLYRLQHHVPPQDIHYGTVRVEQDRGYDMATGFRDHLNSALERLRSASPLAVSMGVTGSSLGSEEEDEEEESEIPNQNLDAQPPTLPPIPSVVADTEDDDWNDRVAFLGNNDTESPAATSGSASPSTTTTRSGQWRRPVLSLNRRATSLANPSLRDHPLPSPLLRDLHDWMDERERHSIASSLWMSATDGQMGSRGEPEPSDTRNSSQDANPNSSSYAGSSAPGGEWDPLSFFSAEQATTLASSSSTTVRSSSASTTVQRNQEEHLIDQGANDTFSETTSSTSSSPSSSSLFATPTSVFHSRNLADQEAVRSLDHGVGTGLGFSGPPRMLNLRPHLNERIVRYPTVVTHNLAYAAAGSRGEGSPNASAALFENNPIGDNDRSSRRPSLPRFSSQDLSRPFWPDIDVMFDASGNSTQHRENSPTASPTTNINRGGGEGSLFHDYMRQWLPSPALDSDLRGLHRRYPWTEREPETPDGPPYLPHHPALPLRVRPSHMQPRPGTSTSLVAESAVEARRRADYVDLQRSSHLARGEIPGESTLESINRTTVRNLAELEAYRRQSQNLEELFERGVDEPSLRPSERNPYRYPLERSSHIQAHQGSRTSSGPMNYVSSSAVDPPTPGSAVFPRRTLHRTYSGAFSPLNLADITTGRTELNSPTGEEMFNFPAEHAANRSFRRDTQNTGTTSNISTVPTRNSWHGIPQGSREASRETTNARYFLDRLSRPSNVMDMEGVINTSSAEPRRHTLSSTHLVGRGSISEHFSYLDGNPENMRVTPSDAPSLPSPDLGGTFDAERQAQAITSAARNAQLNPLQNFHDLNAPQLNVGTVNTLHAGGPPAPINTLTHQQLHNRREISGNQTGPSEVRRRLHAEYFGLSSPIENEETNGRERDEQRDLRNSSLVTDGTHSGTTFDSSPLSTYNMRMQQNLLSGSTQARTVREQMAYEQHQARMARQNYTSVTSSNNGGPIVIDPEAFRPGPFRNTVQHLHDRSRQQNQRMSSNHQEPSNPPTIPPLPFESDAPVGLRSLTPPRIPLGTPEAILIRSVANRGITSFASARAASMNENRRRQQDEMQSIMASRQARALGASARLAEPTSSQMGISGDRRTRTERVHPDGTNLLRPQYDMVQRLQQVPGHGHPQNASTLARRLDVFAPWEVYNHGPLRANDGPPRDATAQNSARARRGRLSRITPEAFSLRGNRAARAMGDFIRDEDFDGSYEGLVSLTQIIGDAKPKSTPSEILEKMEKAQYKDWATADSDKRCPICLDDYGPTDTVLKLSNCSHWLHQDCLQQWLQTANTCPVCRKSVISSPTTHSRGLYSRHHHIQFRRSPQNARRGPPGPPRPGSGATPDSNANNTQLPGNEDNSSHDAPWRRPS